ncbi:MAG: KpsF/GutQ family sugar-phosphate isomerase [Pseudomonadales bacterium]|nr:KpsF/GutQ family sugar-phosphate isomerase [Gammaproteobacteria bacterium]NNL57116.1 KpsF/GutQ family sugar-phosphate isomerase [Pseudomonadales bacterium]
MSSHIQSARRTISIESDAIAALEQRVGESFAQACELLLHSSGRIVVTGIGKSGHIANKIAATLASTGSPAFFMHAGEASHGDLGMLTGDDAVIAISGSGSTEEIIALLPLIKRMGAPLVALTGNNSSPLAQAADACIDVSVDTEACPLGLAPTSSTTATLVMGDALAVALLEARGFTAEDFAFSHPGGALGKRLLLKVGDVMQRDFPQVSPDTALSDALYEVSSKGMGMTTVVDNGKLCGLFTDGDLRRTIDQRSDIHATRIKDVMTASSKTITPDKLAAEALRIMQENSITCLVVINHDNEPCGVVHLHALIRAGIA